MPSCVPQAPGWRPRSGPDDTPGDRDPIDGFVSRYLIGKAAAFQQAVALLRKFASCEATVLIQGETGTGKELAARTIHYLSSRRDLPFVPVNCGALPDSLLESELFGHTRGAFTDAKEARTGLIGQARGGTLFLDELEAMSQRAQVTLLRFLQDKEYRPLGGAAVTDANVRVIGSTNSDLQGLVRSGLFRSDLLFRLNVLPLTLPPLRERPGDIVLLAEEFLARLNRQSEQSAKVLDLEAHAALKGHRWSGNVRELENVMQRAFLLADGAVIKSSDLDIPPGCTAGIENPETNGERSFKDAKAEAVAEFEKNYIAALLEKTSGNLTLASRLSGKDRSDLGKLLRKHSLDRRTFSGPNSRR